MEIRNLAESDYDQLIELYRELDEIHVQGRPDCFAHREREEIYPRDVFVRDLSHPDGLDLGAFEEEQLVGFAGATLWEKSGMIQGVRTVCLDNLYVLPAYRRRGVATRLFAAVEAWAKEQRAVRLELHVWDFNRQALALYQAMGMTPQNHVLEKKLSDEKEPFRS